MCEVCENAVFVAKSVDTFKNDVSNETNSCSSSKRECMNGECKVCSAPVLVSQIESANITDVRVYQWTKIEKKARKVEISMTVKELVAEFNSQMAELKKHIYVKKKQHKFFILQRVI